MVSRNRPQSYIDHSQNFTNTKLCNEILANCSSQWMRHPSFEEHCFLIINIDLPDIGKWHLWTCNVILQLDECSTSKTTQLNRQTKPFQDIARARCLGDYNTSYRPSRLGCSGRWSCWLPGCWGCCCWMNWALGNPITLGRGKAMSGKGCWAT